MELQIDHVTVAGPRLEALSAAWARAGLVPEYGGPHSNGVTHMALLAFDDGSYVELISTLAPGTVAPLWPAHISGGGGPCAWAVALPDVAAEARRVAALGVKVEGPVSMNRRRPDGVLAEWDLAFLGEGAPGALLPFVIGDRTPRALRVQPGAQLHGSPLRGVAQVVLGVPELEPAAGLFQRVYGWAPPVAGEEHELLGARLAAFAGTPVVLATPLRHGGWLSARLDRYGPSPCAFVLAARDSRSALDRYHLPAPASSGVSWFDPGTLLGTRLGLGLIE